MTDLLQACRHFFTAHNLADWAEALPATPSLTDDGRAAVVAAAKHGFTAAFAFPPFAVQVETLDRLIDETARTPAPVPDNQQYREPFLADDWSKTPNGRVLQRQGELGGREWSPYLLLLSPNPIQRCWGQTGKQIREQFEARDWHGLTVPEYLVLQRLFCEKNGDHRFFQQPEDDSGAHSIWLIDSMDDKNCSVALGKNGVINIQAASVNNRDRRRAALAGMIVPM